MSFLKFLKEESVINNDVYDLLLLKSNNNESYACEILNSMGHVSEEDIAKLKSRFFSMPYTDLSGFQKIEQFPYEEFQDLLAIPFDISDGFLNIAIYDPDNIETKDKIQTKLSFYNITKNLNRRYFIAKKSTIIQKLHEASNPNSNLLSRIMTKAVKENASDIHITPFEQTFEVSLRIDGALEPFQTFGIDSFEKLAISVKILSKLDISENRRPQSGHFQQNEIDFRVSTHPTIHGENIVIRILNKDKSTIDINNIGFSANQIAHLKMISNFTNGIIIFCGPTGSGKTTSIYSILNTIDKKSRNIMTLEDPIEYKIQNARQTEIIPGVINFPEGIRSILRQDPDIILIGEIRDEDTAKMAMRASMTGHLVFSTLHANDSFGAIARLRELSVPSSLIAENIISIVSQRLIKKKTRGRTIISEILNFDDAIRNLIYIGSSNSEIKNYAKNNQGFVSMLDDGIQKTNREIICEEELKKVLKIC